MHPAGEGFGRFFCRNADGLAAIDVCKRCSNFSPVAELQGAFAQPASCDHSDRVGGAAVDFDEGDEALAVLALRVFNAQPFQAEHSQPHPEHLPGTDVAVGLFGVAKVFV